jgi:hypothetical protein
LFRIIEDFFFQKDEVNMKQKKKLVCVCVCARESDVDRMNENDGGNVGGVYASSSSLPFFPLLPSPE